MTLMISKLLVFFFCLSHSCLVVQQFYQSRVIDEFVLKGNTGILKCLVPSFVTDFVQIEAWLADDGVVYEYQPNLTLSHNNDGNFV